MILNLQVEVSECLTMGVEVEMYIEKTRDNLNHTYWTESLKAEYLESDWIKEKGKSKIKIDGPVAEFLLSHFSYPVEEKIEKAFEEIVLNKQIGGADVFHTNQFES